MKKLLILVLLSASLCSAHKDGQCVVIVVPLADAHNFDKGGDASAVLAAKKKGGRGSLRTHAGRGGRKPRPKLTTRR